jgi:hypothetical protein
MPADHRHGITHRDTQDQRPNPGAEGALSYSWCSISGNSDRPSKRSDNGRLSSTSGCDTWRGPGNGRAAVCDSGTLSGTSVEKERRRRRGRRAIQTPSTVQGADPAVSKPPTIPNGLLHSVTHRDRPPRQRLLATTAQALTAVCAHPALDICGLLEAARPVPVAVTKERCR